MEIRKNDEFELTIEDMSEDGAGIGKQDGYIWFVKDAVIGDRIRARAMKMKKNYGFARLMEVLEASKDRVMPECPVARQCGGCGLSSFQMMRLLRRQLFIFKGAQGLRNKPAAGTAGMGDPAAAYGAGGLV